MAAVNYITHQYKTGGYVAVNGKQMIGYLSGDYNANTKIVHNHTTYMLSGGYSNQSYKNNISETQEAFYLPEHTIHRNTEMESSRYRNNRQYGLLKINNRTDKRLLSGEVSLFRNDMPKNENHILMDYRTERVSSAEWQQQKNLQPAVTLRANFKLPQKQLLDFSLGGTYSNNEYQRTYQENAGQSFTSAQEDMYTFSFSGNYVLPLKHHNTLNIYALHNHKTTSSLYEGDYDSWQHLWYSESLLFTTYQQRVNPKISLIVRPGVSFLNYRLHEHELQQFVSLRLNTLLKYQISQSGQFVSYINIGNNTPDISYLNDLDQTIDFIQIQRGNPDIEDVKMYNAGIVLNAQHKKLNVQFNADYMLFADHVAYQYYTENDKIIRSFYQGGKSHLFKTTLDGTYRFSDNLRCKLSGTYLYEKVHNGLYNISDHIFQGTADLNYFWKNFSVNLYGKASTKQMSVWTLTHEQSPVTYGLSAGWTWKNWNIEAGTENPFTRHSYHKENSDYTVYQYSKRYNSRLDQQTGYVKLSYTVDFGKKVSRESGNVNKIINSAILKAE